MHRTAGHNENWHVLLPWCFEGVEKVWAHLVELEKKTPFRLGLRQTRTVLIAHDVRDDMDEMTTNFASMCACPIYPPTHDLDKNGH